LDKFLHIYLMELIQLEPMLIVSLCYWFLIIRQLKREFITNKWLFLWKTKILKYKIVISQYGTNKLFLKIILLF